nr:transcriptional regulator [Buttiauxella sp. 3AFRM03]
MQARKKTGEKVKDIALELGVACQTLYSWLHKYG